MSSLRHSKKGIDILFMAFGTIMIALIAFLLFISIAGKHSKTDDFLMTYHAEDFLLLMESIQAVPGDVAVPYALTKGMELELAQDRYAIVHTASGVVKERWLHLTHGMQVQPGTGIGEFKITKQGNTISISSGSLFIGTKDTCKDPLPKKDFNVILNPGTSSATSITQERVPLITESIQYYLYKNSIGDKATAESLSLTISVTDTSKPTITLRRPNADITRDVDYAYLFCSLANTFKDEYEVNEAFTQTTTHFNAELIIGLPPEQQESFLRERAGFAGKAALILAGFQESQEAPDAQP